VRQAAAAGVLPFTVIGWYFMGGWPLWLAMHADGSGPLIWVAGGLSIALSAIAVTLAAGTVARSTASDPEPAGTLTATPLPV
jgi:hypothetical protein